MLNPEVTVVGENCRNDTREHINEVWSMNQLMNATDPKPASNTN